MPINIPASSEKLPVQLLFIQKKLLIIYVKVYRLLKVRLDYKCDL
jgi:hypothetical protein